MTTLEDLMAAGVPELPRPRKARLTLAAMLIATLAIAAAATTALGKSGLPHLFTGHNKSHATAPAQQRAPAPAPGTAPTPGR